MKQHISANDISTIQVYGSTGRGFRQTAGVREAVTFHSSSSTNFLEMIMSGALKEHNEKVGIDNTTITNLQFDDDNFLL